MKWDCITKKINLIYWIHLIYLSGKKQMALYLENVKDNGKDWKGVSWKVGLGCDLKLLLTDFIYFGKTVQTGFFSLGYMISEVSLVFFFCLVLDLELEISIFIRNLHGLGMSHTTTTSPKSSFRAPWRMSNAVVSKGNAEWTMSKSGHSCPYQNCSHGPPAEKSERGFLSLN